MERGFDSEDIAEIEKRGLKPETVLGQLDIFKRGNLPVNLSEAATLRNGILSLAEEEKAELKAHFESRKDELELLKFVPASGAATRMFKALYTFLEEYSPESESLDEYLDRRENRGLVLFFHQMERLPFFEEVRQLIPDYEMLEADEQYFLFVKTMLREEGLDLGNHPKGLVAFHNYGDHSATAFEEHLLEASRYTASGGVTRLHFTIAKEHRQKFEAELERLKPEIERETGLEYRVSFSYQDIKTDTIAVDQANEPFRDDDGRLFFRPGGHGALLSNLNQQEADIIFIKNIDNVVTPRHLELVSDYKKVLAGKLLQLQEKVFGYLQVMEGDTLAEEVLEQIITFARQELNLDTDHHFAELAREEKLAFLKKKLHRPIRVCGMVKNEGEPGGGPFWVVSKTGETSLQIVESAQIDQDNYQQSKIAQEATHFNPVDLVCGIRDHKGQKFELSRFVDPDTHFISGKTKDGQELKALEHPGLWNGSMADWITVFVEVPVETFNPVKTVADLLKPSHQTR